MCRNRAINPPNVCRKLQSIEFWDIRIKPMPNRKDKEKNRKNRAAI